MLSILVEAGDRRVRVFVLNIKDGHIVSQTGQTAT